MKKGMRLCLFAMLIVACFPLTAAAEIRDGTFEVSPFLGGIFYDTMPISTTVSSAA